MLNENEEFVRQWYKIRQKGFWRYALKTGGFWGLFMAIIMNLFDLSEHSFEEVFLSKSFLIDLIFWIVSGIFLFAGALWALNNYIYKRRLLTLGMNEEKLGEELEQEEKK